MNDRFRAGVSILCDQPAMIGRGRYGLLTNFTGTMPDLTRNVDALLTAGVQVTALFGPEHGLRGSVQAGETEKETTDAETSLPLHETYMRSVDELATLLEHADIDGLIFDMQDIGVRYYTYIWSMYDAMIAAARTGRRFIVLDRPNPLRGMTTAGPGVDRTVASFVGRVDIPLRHGLTVGELARYFNRAHLPAVAGHPVDLQVIEMQGWCRDTDFAATGLPWVPPSPNMPSVDAAYAFCGTGLFEGTTVSEGRGTTKPFEQVGAPWIDRRLLPALRRLDLPGVLFRESWFSPTFHKYAGRSLRGVQLHITDHRAFDPVACGVSMIATIADLYPEFGFAAPGERVDLPDRGYAIDRLWGSSELRETVTGGGDPRELVPAGLTPAVRYEPEILLY
jgi:uncharacterized protein YbbC (DUF1343 family)